jgi:hypothetical protein
MNITKICWFIDIPIGYDQFCLIVDKLIVNFSYLKDELRCWNYLDGKGACSLGIWDRGNRPHGPSFLWQVST